MKILNLKIPGLVFLLFILNSSFLIPNCLCQWVQMSNGMGNVPVYSLAANVNNIFAGTGSGVYLSTDNGTNWTQTSLNNRFIYSLAANGNTIFAGTLNYGVYLSTNNGTSWTQTSLNNQYVRSLAVNGNNVFAGTVFPANGVYKSTNNGTSWAQTSLNNQNVWTLAVNGNNIFAGIYFPANGVYISTDNGTSWTQTSLNNQNLRSLAVNGNNIFAGTNDYGVYKSTNNGTNWTQTSLNNQYVAALAVNGNNIFAGTYLYSVYVSNDNGANWIQRNEGLGGGHVWALCIFNNYVLAGTDTSVYRRPLSELVGIQPISEQLPTHYALEQNYPNPFNPTTKFKIQISKLSDTKLVVFDILGQEVATLVNEQLKPGTYEAEWNGINYPSGVYYYRFSAGDFTDTKKMILIK